MGSNGSGDHAVVNPNRRPTNATCSTVSPFATHRTCPFRIMFITSMPWIVRRAE